MTGDIKFGSIQLQGVNGTVQFPKCGLIRTKPYKKATIYRRFFVRLVDFVFAIFEILSAIFKELVSLRLNHTQ